MSHRLASCGLGLFLLILVLVSSASAEWKEKALYSFQGSPDAATPAGGVVFDKAGNLYGAALGGPSGSQGTVFQLVPPAKQGDPWTESVLYVFQGKPVNDGQIPTGGLIIDGSGNLFGVTGYGGTGGCILLGVPVGCGAVYEMSPPTEKGGKWTETILHSFQSGKDGYFPWGDLVFDSAGNLYGSTYYGGGFGSCNSPFYQYCGTVFKLSPPKTKGGKWKEKVLYAFRGGKDGADPNGGLIFDTKGAIYGTTYVGGISTSCVFTGFVGCGTAFKLTPPAKKWRAWSEKVLYRFKGNPEDGLHPVVGLTRDSLGWLYGTTIGGGSYEEGVVFQLSPTGKSGSWAEKLIHVFTGGKDGSGPMTGLTRDSAGNFYGTATGGASRGGVIFRLKQPLRKGGAWTLAVLYGFSGSPDGYEPIGLMFGKAGAIYGTTLYGGTGQVCEGGCGTIFEAVP